MGFFHFGLQNQKKKQAHLTFIFVCNLCVVNKEDGEFGDQWWSGTATLDGAVILLCREKGDD